MTDEELDLLASSFLDGEATPEEVAMIERDPVLLARIDELRIAQAAVRVPVPAPAAALKEQQLAAALSAFDAADRRTTVMAVPEPQAAPPVSLDRDESVIDLRQRRHERDERQAVAAGRMRWLSAVAGVVVFLAGAVFLIGQVEGGGDDEFAGEPTADAVETAEVAEAQAASPADDGAAESAADLAADSGTDSSADADAAIESESMEADAEEEFAVEESEAEADEEAADDAAADADSDTATAPTIRELAEEGFFGDEPVVSFATVPTSDELLAQVDLPWRQPDSAKCAATADLPAGGEVIGYLPIEIPGDESTGGGGSTDRVVEALYLTVGNESQVILVEPDTCAGIPQ